MEGQKVWSNILSSIKLEVSSSAFKTWFSGSFVLDYQNKTDKNLLVVGVKNNFVKEQVETRYLPVISKIAKEKALPNIDVVFVVAQKEKGAVFENEPLFSGIPQNSFSEAKKADILNPNYSLKNFVVGASNNLAFVAAEQVVSSLGASYNPLLIYGPTGVGKTHLLQAVGNEVIGRVIDAKVLYVTSEKFTNDYIESLRNKTQQLFRQKYRNVDVLLVDDIQFLAGKESTQDEFFHTFNELYLSNRQVVVVCDRHPKELGRMKERLVSRFLGGMAVDIGSADLEMRMAILRSKCKERGLAINNEVISYVAEACEGGARELEGVLVSVLALMRLSDGKSSMEEIKKAIQNNRQVSKPTPSVDKVVDTVCRHFKVERDVVCGPSRRSSFVFVRQVLMYLLRNVVGLSLEEIGDVVGGRDHSTVIYGVGRVEKMFLEKRAFKDELLRIQSEL